MGPERSAAESVTLLLMVNSPGSMHAFICVFNGLCALRRFLYGQPNWNLTYGPSWLSPLHLCTLLGSGLLTRGGTHLPETTKATITRKSVN